jgi:5-methylcytosine-specific restriction endonuclease McrA
MTEYGWIVTFTILVMLYAVIWVPTRRKRRRGVKKRGRGRSVRHPIGPRIATGHQRKMVYRRDGGRCVYPHCRRKVHHRSGRHPRDGWDSCDDCGEIDHDVPHSRGGPTTMSNLVLACFACNREKGTMTGAEFCRSKGYAPTAHRRGSGAHP